MRVLSKGNKKLAYMLISAAICLYPLAASLADIPLGRIPYGRASGILLDIQSDEGMYPIGELVDGDVVRQSFTARTDNPITCIMLKGATYMRRNQGKLCIRLLEAGSQETLYTWAKDVSKMEDNAYMPLSLEGAGSALSGKECMLEITSEGAQQGNAVTLYACRDEAYPDGYLQINGERQPGSLCFQVMEETGKARFWRVKIWLRIYLSIALEAFAYILYVKI